MANLTYSTVKLRFKTPMDAAAARMLVNKWRQPVDGMPDNGRDWLGYIYVNAGVIDKPSADDELFPCLHGYNVAGNLIGINRDGCDLVVVLETKWSSSVAAWGVIQETAFPDADVLFYSEFEEGDRITNDEAYRGKWQIECGACEDDAARTTASDILGEEDVAAVSADTVIEVAEATGAPVPDIDEAVDCLLDIDIYARPWDICDIISMD